MRELRRIGAFILIELFVSPVWTNVRAQKRADIEHRGYVTNAAFYFHFVVPKGLKCISPAPPAPTHGCTITIDRPSNSVLYVDAQYEVGVGPQDALSSEPIAGPLTVPIDNIESLRLLRLAGSEGHEFVLRYKTIQGQTRRRAIAEMKRTITGEEQVRFLILVDCPNSEFQACYKHFSDVLSSFGFLNEK